MTKKYDAWMAYSCDLRKKALDYIEKGHSKEEASQIFGGWLAPYLTESREKSKTAWPLIKRGSGVLIKLNDDNRSLLCM